MVPYVNTPDEARAAVAAVRYPPHGVRGVSKFNRAAGFGEDFTRYFAHSSEELVTIVQIETAEAVENAERIAAVDGVDVLFIGPLDLSVNLGVPAQFDSPVLWEAIRKTARAAKASNKTAGILLTQPAQAGTLKELGFSFVALGSDSGAVVSGLKQNLSALRNPTGA
jgi:2-keto-3-deoxy-L-rhamnonate aldolase RhmA